MRQITVPFNRIGGLFLLYGTVSRANTNAKLSLVVNRVKMIVSDSTTNAPPASANGGIGAIDTGNYQRSWNVTKTKIGGIRGVLIANAAAYMAIIERGRGAGKRMPPLAVIARWAQRRLGLPYNEARRAAWPIAKAIERRGLYARRVMTGNFAKNEYRNAMRDWMGVALDEAADRAFV